MPYRASRPQIPARPELLADDGEDEVGVRLGQVEDLLHRLARADAEQPARADRDLPLDGLEADRARVVPRVQERGEAVAPVRLEQREEDDGERRDAGDEAQLAQRQPGGDEDRRQRGSRSPAPVPRSGWPSAMISSGAAGGQEDRPHRRRAGSACAPGFADEHRDGVQHQRELHQLGGLELQRAGAEPALRAVDLDAEAGQQDQDEQSTNARARSSIGVRRRTCSSR